LDWKLAEVFVVSKISHGLSSHQEARGICELGETEGLG